MQMQYRLKEFQLSFTPELRAAVNILRELFRCISVHFDKGQNCKRNIIVKRQIKDSPHRIKVAICKSSLQKLSAC